MSVFPSSLQEGGGWAVALSGGPDSLALAAMLATKNRNGLALIVDHGLRAESAQEAAMVAGRAEALGLQTKILRWTGEKPITGLMEAARHARYDLLIEACRQAECSQLYLAHQQDDQIETALFRLARRSASSGTALADGVAELAVETRHHAAHDAAAAGERAGVLIAGPLGICFLPAFICLGVIPVVAGLARDTFVSGLL